MRYLFVLLALISVNILSSQPAIAAEVEKVQLELRNYDEITLPSGTFIPVVTTQEISTETCPEGYKVKFIATNDLYLGDTNVVPRNTEFFGYIEKINEPIVGTNASMRIKITKMVLVDGYEMPVKGYIYSSNDNTIGGELTPPAQWVRMPHYQNRFQGISWNHRAATLQMRPGGTRMMGEHTKIPVGDQRIIVLVAPVGLTHVLE